MLRDPRVWFDYVRPGILLYGVKPGRQDSGSGIGDRGQASRDHDSRLELGAPHTVGPTSDFGPRTSDLRLAPVMSLRSRVVAVKGARTGETVGYGARFTASRPTVIATVPAGYADGLDLRLAGRGTVLIAGRRAPIVGAVCMDMMSIDVTGIPVETGDVVTILGRDGHDEITVQEMADAIGTTPYEILCRIGTRIERVYN
jgi:alanine racemase